MQNEEKIVFLLSSFTIIRKVLTFMIRNANYSDIASIVEYLKSVPFDVSRTKLYSAKELYGDFTPDKPGLLDNCLDMQIYRHGRQLFMICDTVDDFDWQRDMARLATLPRQAEWEAYVAQFQGCAANARSDEKWQLMDRIF